MRNVIKSVFSWEGYKVVLNWKLVVQNVELNCYLIKKKPKTNVAFGPQTSYNYQKKMNHNLNSSQLLRKLYCSFKESLSWVNLFQILANTNQVSVSDRSSKFLICDWNFVLFYGFRWREPNGLEACTCVLEKSPYIMLVSFASKELLEIYLFNSCHGPFVYFFTTWTNL